MKKSRFTETQIVAILKEADAGVPLQDLCRRHGISEATYYNWKARYGGLDAIGFVWDPHDAVWDEMYDRLLAFEKKHDHCTVPQEYPDDPKLGSWVGKQRQMRRRGNLSKERIALLDKLGFIWNPRDALWDEMYERLCAFRKQHGHCNVPRSYPGKPRLGPWISTQRIRRKQGTIFKNRIARLDAIGFQWS